MEQCGVSNAAGDRLSPRQRDCLRLVWERRAQSKEIAAELGIGKGTVDNAIAEAVRRLGARDRRDAARIVFGGDHPAEYTVQSAGVSRDALAEARVDQPTEPSSPSLPWRTRERPRNRLTFVQTIGWIAVFAVASIMTLALAISIGGALPKLWVPVLHDLRQLTH